MVLLLLDRDWESTRYNRAGAGAIALAIVFAPEIMPMLGSVGANFIKNGLQQILLNGILSGLNGEHKSAEQLVDEVDVTDAATATLPAPFKIFGMTVASLFDIQVNGENSDAFGVTGPVKPAEDVVFDFGTDAMLDKGNLPFAKSFKQLGEFLGSFMVGEAKQKIEESANSE